MTKPADIHIEKRFVNRFLIVSSLTFLAKTAIVIRELVVASRYGRQDEADAFLIAFLVPSFVVSILGNAMNASFIPVYIQVREKEGRPAAQRLFAGMSPITLMGSLLLAGLIFLAAPAFLPAIASGFSGPKLAMTLHMLKWVTPYVVICGLLSLWTAAVNAQENYTAVVLTPVITPLLIILLFFCCPSFGIWSLVYGTLGGAVLELLVTGTILKRRRFSLGMRFAALRPLRVGSSPDADGASREGDGASLRRVMGQFLPSLAGACLMGSTLIVDQSMAAMLPAGSVAALSYGNKVIGFLLTILSTTLITLLTPYFSKKMAGAGYASLSGALRKTMIRVFLCACILPLIITVWSVPIVRFVFYRGAFTLTDVELVAGVQSFLAWQIPFYITSVILLKLIASMQLNWIQAVVAAVNLTVNIALNYWLMQRMGVYGIALSTTLVYVGSVLMLSGLLWVSARRREKAGGGPRTVLHIITGLGVGGAERMLVSLVGGMPEGGAEPAGGGSDAQPAGERLRVDKPLKFRHVVISLGTKEEGALAGELEKMGVQVQFLGIRAGALPGARALMRLIRWSREIRPDLIQGWMYHGNLAASFVRRFLPGRMRSAGKMGRAGDAGRVLRAERVRTIEKVPLAWTIHHSVGELQGEKRMTRWLIRLGARLSGAVDSIIYVSATSRRQHVALGYRDEQGYTIPNGVDTEVFKPVAAGGMGLTEDGAGPEAGALVSRPPVGEREALIATLGIGMAGSAGGVPEKAGGGAGVVLIGHFARYHPLKDHANFLRAAAGLSAGHPGVYFIMAGKGVDADNPELAGLLKELEDGGRAGIAGRVHLLGMRRDIAKLLTALDIFCLSSSSEALPLSLLEAMASGLPCVTTDTGDAALLAGDTGLVVPPRDPAALAAAVGALVEAGPEKRAALGAAARERIVAGYSLGVVVARYAELYRGLMG